MIDNDKYVDMIKNDAFLSECQKKQFLYFRSNANYVHKDNNKKIVTYVHDYADDFYHIAKLSELLYDFSKDSDVVNKIIKKTKKNTSITDKKIAKYILHKLNSSKDRRFRKKKNETGKCNKWDYIFQNLFRRIKSNHGIPYTTYLDIGCGNGNKTLRFAKAFNINEENIYGTDIEEWGPYDRTTRKNLHNFKYVLENGELDFPDNTFDIVTCFFVLHHAKKLDIVLKELKRVLKPNGALLIFDHNVLDNSEHLLIDIQHLLCAIIYDKKDNCAKNSQYANYYNYMELDYIIGPYDFKYVNGLRLFESLDNHIRYDSRFWVLYKNIKEEAQASKLSNHI